MENVDNLSEGLAADGGRQGEGEGEASEAGIIQGVILFVAAVQSMHKVFINVAHGHVKRASFSPSLCLSVSLSLSLSLSSCSSLPRRLARSSASSLARSVRQTTVNQWASSADSHPGIFPDGQRQRQQQHTLRREGERDRAR